MIELKEINWHKPPKNLARVTIKSRLETISLFPRNIIDKRLFNALDRVSASNKVVAADFLEICAYLEYNKRYNNGEMPPLKDDEKRFINYFRLHYYEFVHNEGEKCISIW